jgi:hypothetical protein
MIPRASGRANAMAKRLAWMKSFGEWWRLDWRIGLNATRHLKAVETPGDRRQIVDRPARLADASYGHDNREDHAEDHSSAYSTTNFGRTRG